MNAYVYQAALWCEECIRSIKLDLLQAHMMPNNPGDEKSYDSDDYPKGPYPEGGGEADVPNHCDGCGVFLDNPLTTDGVEYVVGELMDYLAYKTGDLETLDTWAEHIHWYGLKGHESKILECFLQVRLEETESERPHRFDTV